MVNIKLYEDGGRLIISIENPDSSIKELIKNMLAPVIVGPEKISNVAPPPKMPDEKTPVLPNIGNSSNIVNEATRLIQEQGFVGFVTVCKHYNTTWKNVESNNRPKVKKIIEDYRATMSKRDIASIADDELARIIHVAHETAFTNVINDCMKDCGILSMNDFIESGRRNLEYAYTRCFPAA